MQTGTEDGVGPSRQVEQAEWMYLPEMELTT